MKSLLDEAQSAGWASVFGNSAENEDLTEALKLVQAEIGLSPVWVAPDQCQLLKAGRKRQPVAEGNPGAAESSPERPTVRLARLAIRNAVEKLDSLKPEEQLPPLTRQASLDLLSRFARNIECAEKVVAILQSLHLNHRTDERVMHLLLANTEAIALRKTASLGRPAEGRQEQRNDRGRAQDLPAYRSDIIGSERTVALTRLAIIAEANQRRSRRREPGSERRNT